MCTKDEDLNLNISDELKNYFGIFFESNSIATFIFDKNIKIKMVNLKMQEVLGYTQEELIGLSPFDKFIHPDYVDRLVEKYRNFKKGLIKLPYETEIKYICSNEEIRYGLITISSMPKYADFIVTLIDITDRKKMEIALVESEQKFRDIFENSLDGIFIVDVTADNNFRFTNSNPIIKKHTGINSKDLSVKSLEKVLPFEMIEKMKANFMHCIETNDTFIYLETLSFATGKMVLNIMLIPVHNAEGKVHRIIGIAHDVTMINKVENEIKEKLRLQSMLFDISSMFTNVVVEDIDDLINVTLKKLGEYNNDDRSYIFFFSEDGMSMSNTFEWCKKGIMPEKENLQDIPTEVFPWWTNKLRNFETIIIPKVSELPSEAQGEKEIFQNQDIQSLVVVPIAFENKLIGYMGFDSINSENIWSADSISMLNIVANMLANAIVRKERMLNLRASENHYRAIFENTSAATCIVEENMIISKANNGWKKLFGYTGEELKNRNWEELFSENSIEDIREYAELCRTNPEKCPKNINVYIIAKSGELRDCLLSLAIIPETNKFVANHIDVSEIKRVNRAVKMLSLINKAVLHTQKEKSLLKKACRIFVSHGNYSVAWIGAVTNDMKRNIVPMAYVGDNENFLEKLKLIFHKSSNLESPYRIAIDSGENIIFNDMENIPILAPMKEEIIKNGYKAVALIPLRTKKENIDEVLVIYSNEKNYFNKDEVKLLTEIAGELAYGIKALRIRNERDSVTEKLEISLSKMSEILKQTVDSLAILLEVRDPYTAGHQKRVAGLAVEIAREMNLSDEQIEGLTVASNIHDIGKIYLPSEILCKPGKLTYVEFCLIKEHSKAGFDIIKDIDFPWPVKEIVIQHHERINGSGYPNGLTGDEIMIEAKILAVADVVEAMASHRPYRAALGIEVAMEEIENKKGILFDLEVADCCLKMYSEKRLTFEKSNNSFGYID